MSFFDNDTLKAAKSMAGLKGKDFEGKGLVLQTKSVEKVESQYGAEADSKMVEGGILEEGQTFLYLFSDAEGNSRKLYSTSMPLFFAMERAQLEAGDWVKIYREGTGNKTRYYVEKVEAPIHAINDKAF